MLIPKYLQEISNSMKAGRNFEVAKITCKCGCEHFIVYKYSAPTKFTIKPGFKRIIREDDKLYLIKRNFWGKIVAKIECETLTDEKPRNIVKVKCEKCGLEYVIFDNYIHGYDAIVTLHDDTSSHNDTTLHDVPASFEQAYLQPLEVFVKINQDVPYEDFQEEFPNLDFEAYLTSFDSIEIYGMTPKSKKIKICSEETA